MPLMNLFAERENDEYENDDLSGAIGSNVRDENGNLVGEIWAMKNGKFRAIGVRIQNAETGDGIEWLIGDYPTSEKAFKAIEEDMEEP